MKHRTKPSNGAQVPPVGLSGIDHRAALVVYASKGKTMVWSLVFFSLAVAVVVIPEVLGPPEVRSFYDTPTMVVIAQIGGGVLCVGVFIRALTILFSATPRMVVRHEGIGVNSWVFGSGIIPWAEMSGLLVAGRRWPPLGMLHIALRDRQTLRDRQNRLQRLLWWLGGYPLIWPPSIPVSDVYLQMSAEELVARIRIRFQPELVQHGIRILDIVERRPQRPQTRRMR